MFDNPQAAKDELLKWVDEGYAFIGHEDLPDQFTGLEVAEDDGLWEWAVKEFYGRGSGEWTDEDGYVVDKRGFGFVNAEEAIDDLLDHAGRFCFSPALPDDDDTVEAAIKQVFAGPDDEADPASDAMHAELEEDEEDPENDPWFMEGDRIQTPEGPGVVVKVNAAHDMRKDTWGWYFMCEMESGVGQHENLSTFYQWHDGSSDDLELLEYEDD